MVQKIKASLLSGWTKFEVIWLVTATAIITTVSFIVGDNWLGFISSISGILCVVMAAKGKIATYYFGVIQASTYAYIAYGYHLYGEAMLNALFFLPIQFVGFYVWRKNKAKAAAHGEDVYGKHLSGKQWIYVIVGGLIAVGLYAWFLNAINASQVGLDSFAVVISVVAQVLMTLRYAEQWFLWIAVNILTISLWIATLVSTGGGDYAILVMWIAFLVNSVYGYINWRKLAKDGVAARIAETATN